MKCILIKKLSLNTWNSRSSGNQTGELIIAFFKKKFLCSKAQFFCFCFLDAPSTNFPVYDIKVEYIRQGDHSFVSKKHGQRRFAAKKKTTTMTFLWTTSFRTVSARTYFSVISDRRRELPVTVIWENRITS